MTTATDEEYIDISIGRWSFSRAGGLFIEKADVRVAPEIWRVHKYDADPFPARPHAHCIGVAKRFMGLIVSAQIDKSLAVNLEPRMTIVELDDKRPILSLPYSDRQLIVIGDDELIEATKTKGLAVQRTRDGIQWGEIISAVLLDSVPLPFTRTIQVAAQEALRAWGRARDSGLKVLPVGKKEAEALSFPPGHPREGILYLGHPAIPHVYYTMADFHRVTFEHKFSEAIEVLMSLGATWIKVEHVRGWSKEFSSRISIPLADTSSSAEIGANAKSGSQLLYEANLSGVQPSLPDDLVWYHHEPTWQSIAKGRLKYGLTDFSMSVSYEDDFGVNAGMKLSVSKTGLDVGGRFEDHVATTWRLEGKFLPQSNGV